MTSLPRILEVHVALVHIIEVCLVIASLILLHDLILGPPRWFLSMRQWIGLDATIVTLRDSSPDYSTLRTTLEVGVRFGAHDGLVRATHVPDPHVELFALRVFRGLSVILTTWQLI